MEVTDVFWILPYKGGLLKYVFLFDPKFPHNTHNISSSALQNPPSPQIYKISSLLMGTFLVEALQRYKTLSSPAKKDLIFS